MDRTYHVTVVQIHEESVIAKSRDEAEALIQARIEEDDLSKPVFTDIEKID